MVYHGLVKVFLKNINMFFIGGLTRSNFAGFGDQLTSQFGTYSRGYPGNGFWSSFVYLAFPRSNDAPLIRKMGLIKRGESQDEYERRQARAVMSKAAYERLETLQHNGF